MDSEKRPAGTGAPGSRRSRATGARSFDIAMQGAGNAVTRTGWFAPRDEARTNGFRGRTPCGEARPRVTWQGRTGGGRVAGADGVLTTRRDRRIGRTAIRGGSLPDVAETPSDAAG